jgi:hypothetical protein
MQLIDLAQKLHELKGEFGYSDWPEEIILPKESFGHFERLEKYTASEDKLLFQKSVGTLAWEYAITVVCHGREFYYGKPTKGNNTSVIPETNIKRDISKYNPNKGEVDFKLDIGDVTFRTRSYKIDYVKDNKNFVFTPIMVVHTHPKYHHDDGSHQYTFFSGADLSFLSKGWTNILGLITKNSFWLACRTINFRTIDQGLLHQVTNIERSSGEEGMKKFIAENFQSMGVVFYQGKLRGKLLKIRFTTTGNKN